MSLTGAAKHYAATMAVILTGFLLVSELPYFRGVFGTPHALPSFGIAFTSLELFSGIVAAYALVLFPYYLLLGEQSASAKFLPGLFRAEARDAEWRNAGLKIAIKAFFAPLMLHWTVAHFLSILDLASRLSEMGWGLGGAIGSFDLYVLVLKSVLLVDVALFTFGYLVEADALGNRIVSAEPTASGWFVCLACYPPFNGPITALLGWHPSDNPNVPGNEALTAALNILVIGFMVVYAWATVALGTKASNLTNRGIVTRGPYRYVRHPAYIAKNTAWWIGATPVLLAAPDLKAVLLCLVSLSAWSYLYYLRAVTEERHLELGLNGYAEYKRQVPYRFIPRVW